uniref:Uncharacterized protein n=1 Tax=Rhizophora mucronata TaxID=61149 RepID=A0A2P2MLF9_RHIMU
MPERVTDCLKQDHAKYLHQLAAPPDLKYRVTYESITGVQPKHHDHRKSNFSDKRQCQYVTKS